MKKMGPLSIKRRPVARGENFALQRRAVAEAGTAIGVVCTTTSPREGGPNARLSDNLPGWLLRDTL